MEWQKPVAKDRDEVLSWLAVGKKAAPHSLALVGAPAQPKLLRCSGSGAAVEVPEATSIVRIGCSRRLAHLIGPRPIDSARIKGLAARG